MADILRFLKSWIVVMRKQIGVGMFCFDAPVHYAGIKSGAKLQPTRTENNGRGAATNQRVILTEASAERLLRPLDFSPSV